MSLVTLNPGDIADVSPLNINFTYLDGRITTSVSAINNTLSSHTSSINTLTTTVDGLTSPSIISLSTTTPTLTDGRTHSITISGNTTFTLPVIADTTKFHQILVLVSMPTAYTITLGTSKYFYNTAPDMSATGNYTLIYEYDGTNWVVGSMYKG